MVELRNQINQNDTKKSQMEEEIKMIEKEIEKMEKEEKFLKENPISVILKQLLEENKFFFPTLESYKDHAQKNHKINEICLKLEKNLTNALIIFSKKLNENEKVPKKIKKKVETDGKKKKKKKKKFFLHIYFILFFTPFFFILPGEVAIAINSINETIRENHTTRETFFEDRLISVSDLNIIHSLINELTSTENTENK